jgi:hypothetical protein
MKLRLIFGFLLLSTCLATLQKSSNSLGKPIIDSDFTKGFETELKIIESNSNNLVIQIVTINRSDHVAYIMTHPSQVSGTETKPYIIPYQEDGATLDFDVRLFRVPRNVFFYVNATHVTLSLLSTGQKNIEEFTLNLPIRNTVPPYDSPSKDIVDMNRIKRLRACVGVLPYESGVNELFMGNVSRTIGGPGMVESGAFAGKDLLDIQSLVCSSSVAVPN